MKKKSIAMGWLVVIACIFIKAVPYNVLACLQGQFMPFVLEDKSLGFNVATFSFIFTIGTLVSAVASPIVSGLFKKYSVKALFVVGSILGCVGFAAHGIATAPWQYYLISIVMQIGLAIFSALGIPLLVNTWFDDSSKGKALSITMAGGSVGNIFLQAGSVGLIQAVGFKKAYLLLGLVSLVIGVLATLLVVRMPKNDDEIVKGKVKEDKTQVDSSWGYTVKEAIKTKGFAILAGSFFFVGIYVAALSMQYPAYLRENSAINTGTVGSIFAIASLFGSLAGGSFFDKFGPFKAMLIGGISVGLSTIALIFALDIPMLANVFGILNGFALFAYTMGPALLTGKLFGNKEYAGILGLVQLVFGIGFAAGSSLFGVIANSFGYRVAWIFILVSIVISYTGVSIASITMEKANKEKFAKEAKEEIVA